MEIVSICAQCVSLSQIFLSFFYVCVFMCAFIHSFFLSDHLMIGFVSALAALHTEIEKKRVNCNEKAPEKKKNRAEFFFFQNSNRNSMNAAANFQYGACMKCNHIVHF